VTLPPFATTTIAVRLRVGASHDVEFEGGIWSVVVVVLVEVDVVVD
jgi:hypothetical protein